MRDALTTAFPDQTMVFDKRVNGGCSARRPDIRIEMFTHTIVVECDETRHIGYSCESKRTMQLFQDCGNRPMVLIRFNPDAYTTSIGERVSGCFTKTQTGYSLRAREWNARVEKLVDAVRDALRPVTRNITTVHLFYE